jgi:hypothetical protein
MKKGKPEARNAQDPLGEPGLTAEAIRMMEEHPLKHPARPRPRADRYESQLNGEEMAALRYELLQGRKSLRKLVRECPPWRDGPDKGKRISQSTLTNIRNRLLAEESFIAAEAMTERIVAKVAVIQPDMKPAALEEFGLGLFTTLAIQNRDADGFVKLVRARKESESVKLDAKRFQRETCELFLKWSADQRAKEIANTTGSNADKIEALGALMFGEEWKK